MKIYPVMFAATCSIFLAWGMALPKLVARQGGCESVVCWPDLSDGPDIGSTLGGLWHLFQKDESIPGAPPDDTRSMLCIVNRPLSFSLELLSESLYNTVVNGPDPHSHSRCLANELSSERFRAQTIFSAT